MDINKIRTTIWTALVGASNSFRTYIIQSVLISSTPPPPVYIQVFKLFFNEAPMFLPTYSTTEVTFPYVVFDILPITTSRDSASKFYSFILQFRIAALTQDDAEDVAAALIALLEDSESSITFTGYSTIQIEKQPVVVLGKIENVFNIIVPYSFNLEQ